MESGLRRPLRTDRAVHHTRRHLQRYLYAHGGGGRGGGDDDHHRSSPAHNNACRFSQDVSEFGEGERGHRADHRVFPASGSSLGCARSPARIRTRDGFDDRQRNRHYSDHDIHPDHRRLRDGDHAEHRDPLADPPPTGTGDRHERDSLLHHDGDIPRRRLHHSAARLEPVCGVRADRHTHSQSGRQSSALRPCHAFRCTAACLRARALALGAGLA